MYIRVSMACTCLCGVLFSEKQVYDVVCMGAQHRARTHSTTLSFSLTLTLTFFLSLCVCACVCVYGARACGVVCVVHLGENRLNWMCHGTSLNNYRPPSDPSPNSLVCPQVIMPLVCFVLCVYMCV